MLQLDDIEAEHAAIELLSNHYEQFRNVCKRCCAHVRNRGARMQLAEEMLGEVFDKLPSICRNYDAAKSNGQPLIAWATYNVQFYLRKFKQYPRESFANNELEKCLSNSLFAKENQEIKENIADEFVCIIRQILSAEEWQMIWLRHAEDYTIEQVAHVVNLSVTHTDRKLKRIEKLIRDTFADDN